MDEANDTTVVATVPESDAGDQAGKVEQKPDRPKLTDEEQLNVLEGRANRLRTKLGLDKDTPKTSSDPDAQDLLQDAFLFAAGITEDEEAELAKTTAKKWGMNIKQVLKDEDFKAKLEKHRATKANELATSDVKGSGSTSQANQTPDYWIAKGQPPTADQVPDRKVRATIVNAMMASKKGSTNPFYNGK